MGVLSILMSTGRVGNALVALRCIDVRDKSLSLAFNVVFLSLIGKNLHSTILSGSSDQATNPESTNPETNHKICCLFWSAQNKIFVWEPKNQKKKECNGLYL